MPKVAATFQTAVRFPSDWRPRLEAIGEKLGTPGLSVSQSDVIRVALLRGIGSLETELGLALAPERAPRGEAKPRRT